MQYKNRTCQCTFAQVKRGWFNWVDEMKTPMWEALFGVEV